MARAALRRKAPMRLLAAHADATGGADASPHSWPGAQRSPEAEAWTDEERRLLRSLRESGL